MILIESGERTEKSFDAKLVFARQLASRGHRVVLDDRVLPERLDRNQKYEAAAFLATLDGAAISRVLVIGAEAVSQETMLALRGFDLAPEVSVAAIGRFPQRQAAIGAQAKIAYATGHEPTLVDLSTLLPQPLLADAVLPLAAVPARRVEDGGPPRLFIFLAQETLDNPQVLPVLAAMDQLPDWRLNLILPGRGKELIKATRYDRLRVLGYSEVPPATIAALADIAVFFGDGVPGERMAAFALDLMRSGGAVVDCTATGAFQASGAPVVRGGEDLAALADHLLHTVLVNRQEIGRRAQESRWLTANGIENLERALGLPVPVAGPAPVTDRPTRTVFLPTNGVGLGHARRCTLVAEEMAGSGDIAFAAFPSCVPMIVEKGFDCLPLVQKSPDHDDEFANDLITYLRLDRSLRPGDRLVFDGGYVFDSIHRVILDKGLDATWLRRGLPQPNQNASATLDREPVFRQVIVPTEAFDELNAVGEMGRAIRHVGPIVQRLAAPDAAERTRRRKALSDRLGHAFDQLVITMLGGGVASDRAAQMQALAALLDDRKRCLHLIVVWPGAVVPPGLNGWRNTRVVQTRRALSLCQIADLTVSAAGYNSFHELLYHGLPAIFVPQVASFLDDQDRRARAAADRGLAGRVKAQDLLVLEREVTAFLDTDKADGIRAALAAATLPTPGNARAAALIREGTAQ